MPRSSRVLLLFVCGAAALWLGGCGTMKKLAGPLEPALEDERERIKPSGEAVALLGMTYAEAATISPQKMDVPPFFKVAADEIEIVRKNKDGSPRNVRAKGKVFLAINFAEPATALCQEAYFGDEEVILRGHPLLKRGGSVVEGLASSTVFYMYGSRLRVIGQHRLTNEGQVMESLPEEQRINFRRSGGSWGAGPNPLLPPLSPSAVPADIRSEMQKAAEAEAVLQRARTQPMIPLKEDSPAEKPVPLTVPPPAGDSSKKEPPMEKEPTKEEAKEPKKEPGKDAAVKEKGA